MIDIPPVLLYYVDSTRGDFMSFKTGSVAIYRQLIEHFELEIASGRLAKGARIDSIRDLALQFKVNPNTVQKALSELERDGLINTDRTNGKFVVEDEALISELSDRLASNMVTNFIDNAHTLGFSKEKAITLIEKEWSVE